MRHGEERPRISKASPNARSRSRGFLSFPKPAPTLLAGRSSAVGAIGRGELIQFSRVMNLMNPDTRWWPASTDSNGDAVTVVTVSYNTAELTAMLLWSLHRVLDEPGIAVVVVDNGSTDGTLELLGPPAGTGYCRLLSLQENRGHGPALNHAFEVLAADRTLPGRVWILDSDCVVA
jgi:hypothetical protein